MRGQYHTIGLTLDRDEHMKESDFEPGMLVKLKQGCRARICLAKNAFFIRDEDKTQYTFKSVGTIDSETIMCYLGVGPTVSKKLRCSYGKNFLTNDGQVIWIYDNDVTHFEPILDEVPNAD